MGGRIGLERGTVSTIDHVEAFLLQILMVKHSCQRAAVAATAMEGQLGGLLRCCMLWRNA